MTEGSLKSIQKAVLNEIQPVASKEEGIQRHPNPIVEERYQLVLALYLIRKESRGKYGLFQPDFIWKIFRPFLRNPRCYRTDEDMRGAVREWCADPVAAEDKFGHINDWDTSTVTSMKYMFHSAASFNADISRWNVSAVTNMRAMFLRAAAFDTDMSSWNVSSVTERQNNFFHCAIPDEKRPTFAVL